MELAYELTHSMFKDASIFSLVYAGWGDFLAPFNPTKKRDTWKGKYKAMKLRCSTLQCLARKNSTSMNLLLFLIPSSIVPWLVHFIISLLLAQIFLSRSIKHVNTWHHHWTRIGKLLSISCVISLALLIMDS